MFYFRKNKIHAIKHDLTAGKKNHFAPQGWEIYLRKGIFTQGKVNCASQKNISHPRKEDFSSEKGCFTSQKWIFPQEK